MIRKILLGTLAGLAFTGAALALPVAVPHISSDSAATATLTAYTANPTIVDSSPSLMGALLVDLPVTTAAGGRVDVERTYGTGNDMFSKGLDLLKGSSQQLCVNLNGVSVSSGVLSITMEWVEN